MKENYLNIIDHSEKKVSFNGNEYMIITLKDMNNDKEVDYHIFINRDKAFWEAIENSDYKDKRIPGKIVEIDVTPELIKKATVNKPDGEYEPKDSFRMVVWERSEWKNLSEEFRIVISLKDQVWKLNNKYGRESQSYSFDQDIPYSDKIYRVDDPANDPNQNPWIEVFGEGEEAETAYWNTH